MRKGGNRPPSCRLLIVGDSGVGKTCFVRRLRNAAFTLTPAPPATIVMDVETVVIKSRDYGDPETEDLTLHIFDAAGNDRERYMPTLKSIYHNLDGVLFAYDVTVPETLHHIISSESTAPTWYSTFTLNNQNGNVVKVLLGLKADCPSVVDVASETKAAKDIGAALSSRCSTLGDDNFKFEKSVAEIIRHIMGAKVERDTVRELNTFRQQPQHKKTSSWGDSCC